MLEHKYSLDRSNIIDSGLNPCSSSFPHAYAVVENRYEDESEHSRSLVIAGVPEFRCGKSSDRVGHDFSCFRQLLLLSLLCTRFGVPDEPPESIT